MFQILYVPFLLIFFFSKQLFLSIKHEDVFIPWKLHFSYNKTFCSQVINRTPHIQFDAKDSLIVPRGPNLQGRTLCSSKIYFSISFLPVEA